MRIAFSFWQGLKHFISHDSAFKASKRRFPANWHGGCTIDRNYC
jgi:hypothetical protein